MTIHCTCGVRISNRGEPAPHEAACPISSATIEERALALLADHPGPWTFEHLALWSRAARDLLEDVAQQTVRGGA